MRQLILALLLVILVVFTASCGKQGEINYQDESPSANTEINASEEQNTDQDNSVEQENSELEETSKSTPVDDKVDSNKDNETELDKNNTTNLDNNNKVNSDENNSSDVDAWGVDWESYKTFDVSELFDVSEFLFDVITALSDKVDPSYEATSGIAYTFTSTDSIMMDSKERHQLKMSIGNPRNSDTDVDFYNGDENWIINRFDDYVENGMGSTMYDAQFRVKGKHKMFSYKYIGYARTKYTISGRIYLANADDSVPSQNSSNPDNKYRQKWIEFLYTSPQVAKSTDSVVTEKEIEQFDKFFDHVVESLIIEE